MNLNLHAIGLLHFATCHVLMACGDSEAADTFTDDVIVSSFEVAECRSQDDEHRLANGGTGADYPGLACILWNLESPLRIDLVHLESECGFQGLEPEATLWRGSAQQIESTLQVNAQWEFAHPSACGACSNSFSFVLNDVEPASTTRLKVRTRGCVGDCRWEEDEIDVSSDELRQGIRCRYVNWDQIHLSDNQLGLKNRPARGTICNAGLRPVMINEQEICLAECNGDSECFPENLMNCREHVCVLAERK